MFCSKCGRKLRDDEIFCSGCGNEIIREKEPSIIEKNTIKDETKDTEPKYMKEAKVRRPISKGLSKITVKLGLALIAISIVIICNTAIKINEIDDEYEEMISEVYDNDRSEADRLSEKKHDEEDEIKENITETIAILELTGFGFIIFSFGASIYYTNSPSND